jgi:hypothetical protein
MLEVSKIQPVERSLALAVNNVEPFDELYKHSCLDRCCAANLVKIIRIQNSQLLQLLKFIDSLSPSASTK